MHVNNIADHHGAADMRRDQAHILAGLFVDDPRFRVAGDGNRRIALARLIENGEDVVDIALRLGPFPIEPRLDELGLRDELEHRLDFTHIKQKLRRKERTDRRVMLEIRPRIVWIVAPRVEPLPSLERGVVAKNHGAGSVHKGGDALEHLRPQALIQCRVVNRADQAGKNGWIQRHDVHL